ncbi:hypothetical protein DCS_01644 [Drechmeria coniospora]|uniref:AA1-like domain-containing protein n=1 Tax=Drechmeria coniospora TaxID=98403 RepID=A0A151GTT3_DRECN|nr:hypothetical protein DCS_01644 [Drechmeria coniospora]KYK60507.1 hypothetical protein DCS_01644 [Drechmeria coniospora]ODA80662.1 hypothetical protein RJ55_03621 [Drechmeria coniospora]
MRLCPVSTILVHLLATPIVAGLAIASPATAVDFVRGPNDATKSKLENWWTVRGFNFYQSIIFHSRDNHTSSSYINFSLTHPAVPYTARCSAETGKTSGSSLSKKMLDFLYGANTYLCRVPNTGDSARFRYDSLTGELSISHIFIYPYTGVGYYNVTGSVRLNCAEDFEHEPNWTKEQVYSNRTMACTDITVKFPATKAEFWEWAV